MKFALFIFVIMYAAILLFPKKRDIIAISAAVILILYGIMPLSQIPSVINLNVLLMIAGTMGLVCIFINSKMPNLIADILLDNAKTSRSAILILAVFAGLISVFIDNVATVLMITPIAIEMAKKIKINPVSVVIAMTVTINLQSAATLVGDPASILLGSAAGLDFSHFFWLNGKPGIFFATECGALAAVLLLLLIFRKEKDNISIRERTEVHDYFPTVLMLLMIILLVAVSFIKNKPPFTNGLICAGLFVIGMIYEDIRNKKPGFSMKFLKEIDYSTILLLLGLFIVIGAIENVGIIEMATVKFLSFTKYNVFYSYLFVIFAGLILSAFINNISLIAIMLPVLSAVSAKMMMDPYLLYFGLIIGVTLGGNLTPIGANSNIAASGLLRKSGYEFKAKDIAVTGIPMTLAAEAVSAVFVWMVWGTVS